MRRPTHSRIVPLLVASTCLSAPLPALQSLDGPGQPIGGQTQEEYEAPTEEVVVDRDDFVLDRSARVRFATERLVDGGEPGVLIIRGEDLVVDLTGARLHGAATGPDGREVDPDAYTGVGIRIEGTGIRLRGATVSGFKVGIDARGVDRLILEDCDVSGNFRQRLKSTPEREHADDWLYPHDNDGGEWLQKYGAGIHVKDSKDVRVRRCRARAGQNGLILDRVNESRIYDNDFSFLSGWGIAMWRSNKNVVSRNSLDFNVRGYSHGVYNRGQDSAGLLMFEQCYDNVVAENSMSHSGDGVFGFAGKEALGDVPGPPGFKHTRKGCNRNRFIRNDLSHNVAHGLEMTFSFSNEVYGNRLKGNAICGIWGGYSQDFVIAENLIRENGDMGYGLERGGINIEHGKGHLIQFNTFFNNEVGIRLWWDEDPHIADKPWVAANGFECGRSILYGNLHQGDRIGVEISGCPEIVMQQADFRGCGEDVVAEGDDAPFPEGILMNAPPKPSYVAYGTRQAVGGVRELEGRQNILMTEWGPYDWSSPLLTRGEDIGDAHVWRVLGAQPRADGIAVTVKGNVDAQAFLSSGDQGPEVHVFVTGQGWLDYELRVDTDQGELFGSADQLSSQWELQAFPSPVDPREDVDAWRAGAAAEGALAFSTHDPRFRFGMGGFADLVAADPLQFIGGGDFATLGTDRFGVLATTTVELPAGTYTLRARSDDGLRVLVGDEVLLEDWTQRGAKTEEATFEVAESGPRTLRVEYFELDGAAELTLELARAAR